jgi:CRISPR system Cascade subunit CasE
MLYLSRLILDTQSHMARRDLADCHQLHRRLLSAFPEAPDTASAREHFGLLYRAESFAPNPRLVRVLVQSAAVPDWSRLPKGYLATPLDERGNPAVRQIDAEYEQIRAGIRLVFRLRANPTMRVGANNTEQDARWRGKRIELRREEDQLAWLARKGERGGFRLAGVDVQPELPDTRVASQEKARGRRPARDGGSPMTLSFGAALFEGRLEVTDPAAFVATLRAGIGSGKAFGFGLLSIATAR